MTFYEDMQNLATDLLTEFNQGTIQIIKMTAAGGKGWKPGTPSERVVNVQGAARGAKAYYIANSLAQEGDLQVSHNVPADPADYPTVADMMTIDGTRFKIVSVTQKPAAGTPVAFSCIVRKGG